MNIFCQGSSLADMRRQKKNSTQQFCLLLPTLRVPRSGHLDSPLSGNLVTKYKDAQAFRIKRKLSWVICGVEGWPRMVLLSLLCRSLMCQIAFVQGQINTCWFNLHRLADFVPHLSHFGSEDSKLLLFRRLFLKYFPVNELLLDIRLSSFHLFHIFVQVLLLVALFN